MSDKYSELREIKRMGGKPQKNSGRGKYQKGDARLGDFIVDVKEYNSSFNISKEVWAKISTDAVKSGGEPALMLAIGDPPVRLWVIGDSMFQAMLEAYGEKYGQ